MMGELARRYPPQSLVVSTGRAPDSAASDARYPQPVDRAGIRATRLRTLNGLALWTWRAGQLAREFSPRFTWCAELKPAGYPARWLAWRRGIPYGVVVHGTELLLLDAKIRRSRFKRWTGGALLGGAAVVVANSRWTGELARSVYDRLGRPDLARRVEVVPLGTSPERFRPGLDPGGNRRQCRPCRRRLGCQRRHGHLRLGDDGPGRVRQGPLRRPGDCLESGHGPAGLLDPDPGAAGHPRSQSLLAFLEQTVETSRP